MGFLKRPKEEIVIYPDAVFDDLKAYPNGLPKHVSDMLDRIIEGYKKKEDNGEDRGQL